MTALQFGIGRRKRRNSGENQCIFHGNLQCLLSWNTFRLIAFGRSNAGILMSSGTLKSRAAPRAA